MFSRISNNQAGKETGEAKAKDTPPSALKQNRHPKPAPTGPVDFSQVSTQNLDGYVDFGAFLVPKIPGLAIQPEGVLGDNAFRALTVQIGTAVVEVMAVAAPKSRSLWDELRAEVRGEVTKQGNTSEEISGSFGTELLVQMAAQTHDGKRGRVQMRYAGVDGPNWFVRMVFNGALEPDSPQLQSLENAVKQFVVVRGSEPLTPRSLIPVVLPDDLVYQLRQIQAQA